MIKTQKFWINGLAGAIIVLLIMIMAFFIVDYRGSVHHGYVSLYGFIESSGKSTTTIDKELAVMQVDGASVGTYASELIVCIT